MKPGATFLSFSHAACMHTCAGPVGSSCVLAGLLRAAEEDPADVSPPAPRARDAATHAKAAHCSAAGEPAQAVCRLRRCVPRLLSREALLVLVQGGLLVSRTFLTDRISRIEARAGRHLIAQVSARPPWCQ